MSLEIEDGSCACADGKINVPGNRLELNAKMAVTLGAPVLMVLDAQGGTCHGLSGPSGHACTSHGVPGTLKGWRLAGRMAAVESHACVPKPVRIWGVQARMWTWRTS